MSRLPPTDRALIRAHGAKVRTLFLPQVQAFADTETLQGACTVLSLVLHQVLRVEGYPVQYVDGWYVPSSIDRAKHGLTRMCAHAWLELGPHVIDCTATQFGHHDAVVVVSGTRAARWCANRRGALAVRHVQRMMPGQLEPHRWKLTRRGVQRMLYGAGFRWTKGEEGRWRW